MAEPSHDSGNVTHHPRPCDRGHSEQLKSLSSKTLSSSAVRKGLLKKARRPTAEPPETPAISGVA